MEWWQCVQAAEYQTPRQASPSCGSQLSSTFSLMMILWVGWIQYTAMIAHIRITCDQQGSARCPTRLLYCRSLRLGQVAAHIRMEPQNTAEKDEMKPLTRNCSSGNIPTTRTNPQIPRTGRCRLCRHMLVQKHLRKRQWPHCRDWHLDKGCDNG